MYCTIKGFGLALACGTDMEGSGKCGSFEHVQGKILDDSLEIVDHISFRLFRAW
jgi:hypothetical protein